MDLDALTLVAVVVLENPSSSDSLRSLLLTAKSENQRQRARQSRPLSKTESLTTPSPPHLLGEGRQFFSFEFELDQDAMPDRRIMVWVRNAEITAEMYGEGFGEPVGEEQLGAVRAWRPDDHRVKIAFHKRMLEGGVDRIRWRGITSFEAPRHEFCPRPEPHGDGGYGTCSGFTTFLSHK